MAQDPATVVDPHHPEYIQSDSRGHKQGSLLYGVHKIEKMILKPIIIDHKALIILTAWSLVPLIGIVSPPPPRLPRPARPPATLSESAARRHCSATAPSKI